ncbi:MAG: secondary thiamine-phosphate synthase enzyme YjbQ [Chloroflexia bacterium]
MWSRRLEVRTGDRQSVNDLTPAINDAVGELGDGLLNILLPHATAGLALIETGSGSDDDLLDRLEGLLPRNERYRHRHGAPGHGRDHLLPAFISPSLTLPVVGGRLQLGTWQSVVLVDTNADNPVRQVWLSFATG